MVYPQPRSKRITKTTKEIPRSQRKTYAIWSERLSFPFDRIRIFLWSDREVPKVLLLIGAFPPQRTDLHPSASPIGPCSRSCCASLRRPLLRWDSLKPLLLRHRAEF